MEINTSSNTEDTPLDPSAQPQEGLPSQEGPLTWFLEHLNATMDRIE